MAGGRKTVKSFGLYSEELLEPKYAKWGIILVHLISFLLGIMALIIGVFSYAPTAPSGEGSIPQVNCTLAASFVTTRFPLKLLLLLTGIVLIIVDVNISVILCLIKYCGCAVLTVVWFLVETVCLFAWVAWSIVYLEAVFPVWLEDKALCDNLIMIMTIVAVSVACIFATFYAVAIVVVICYESKRRCAEKDCSCC